MFLLLCLLERSYKFGLNKVWYFFLLKVLLCFCMSLKWLCGCLGNYYSRVVCLSYHTRISCGNLHNWDKQGLGRHKLQDGGICSRIDTVGLSNIVLDLYFVVQLGNPSFYFKFECCICHFPSCHSKFPIVSSFGSNAGVDCDYVEVFFINFFSICI